MDFDDFLEGFLTTLRWCAPVAGAHQEVTRAALDGPARAALDAHLAAYWTAHGADIMFAPGIPGLSRGVAWQAGHDLAFELTGRSAFAPGEWRAGLAARLRGAARALGRVELSQVAGEIAVTHRQGAAARG